MGLYTKNVKEDTPVKEVKKRGRPKKVVKIEEPKEEVEQPKEPIPEPVEKEVQLPKEEPLPPNPKEKTSPPPEPVVEELPLKKDPPKKKASYKGKEKATKVEKKSLKDEEPPSWFKKFLSEGPLSELGKTKPESDFKKETATKLWNDRVKPKYSKNLDNTSYDRLYSQIFGR